MFSMYPINIYGQIRFAIFRPACIIKDWGPNMQCKCNEQCKGGDTLYKLLYYNKLKSLPIHSLSSEANKIKIQKSYSSVLCQKS